MASKEFRIMKGNRVTTVSWISICKYQLHNVKQALYTTPA